MCDVIFIRFAAEQNTISMECNYLKNNAYVSAIQYTGDNMDAVIGYFGDSLNVKDIRRDEINGITIYLLYDGKRKPVTLELEPTDWLVLSEDSGLFDTVSSENFSKSYTGITVDENCMPEMPSVKTLRNISGVRFAVVWNGSDEVFGEVGRLFSENGIGYDVCLNDLGMLSVRNNKRVVCSVRQGDVLVVSLDGTVLSIPKDTYDALFDLKLSKEGQSALMSFGTALQALKKGMVVRRNGWKRGKYLFLQTENTISKGIAKKTEWGVDARNLVLGTLKKAECKSMIMEYNTTDSSMRCWHDTDDLLAEDWTVVNVTDIIASMEKIGVDLESI